MLGLSFDILCVPSGVIWIGSFFIIKVLRKRIHDTNGIVLLSSKMLNVDSVAMTSLS